MSVFALVYRENRGEADTVAQTYAVSMTMQRPAQWNILPGMTAQVTVELRDPQAAEFSAVIPVSALVGDAQQGFFVWLYDMQSHQVEKRGVVVGQPRKEGLEIVSGLVDGDLVVATGASQLQANMRIKRSG